MIMGYNGYWGSIPTQTGLGTITTSKEKGPRQGALEPCGWWWWWFTYIIKVIWAWNNLLQPYPGSALGSNGEQVDNVLQPYREHHDLSATWTEKEILSLLCTSTARKKSAKDSCILCQGKRLLAPYSLLESQLFFATTKMGSVHQYFFDCCWMGEFWN